MIGIAAAISSRRGRRGARPPPRRKNTPHFIYTLVIKSRQPSERLFSAAGLTIENGRARLLPENAELLVFMHENWGPINAYRAARRLSIL